MTYPTIRMLTEDPTWENLTPDVRAWIEQHAPVQWAHIDRSKGTVGIFRGASCVEADDRIIQPRDTLRRSRMSTFRSNLTNYLVPMAWPDVPDRRKAVIGSTGFDQTKQFGSCTYLIIPPDDAKCAVLQSLDFNFVTRLSNITPYVWLGPYNRAIQEMMARLGPAIKDSPDLRAAETSSSMMEKLATMSGKEIDSSMRTMESRDVRILNALAKLYQMVPQSERAGVEKTLLSGQSESSRPIMERVIKAMRGEQVPSLTEMLVSLMPDSRAVLDIMTAGELIAKDLPPREVWFEGPCAAIKLRDARHRR